MAKPNSIRVPYASAVYGKEEIRAVNRILANPQRIVAGESVREFERQIAKAFGKSHGLMVNSGSSANLIALEVINLPPGSEVITPALTFSTTLAPILQKGLTPVFVDVEEGTYVVNVDQVEAMITKKTSALMIPSILGNIPDLERLQKLAKKHDLWLIEDSCDTLGPSFKGKPTGHYSDITTTSFYASHIITAAGGGGMVCFHDKKLALRALVMSSWGRQSTLFGVNEKSEDLKKRFSTRIGGKVYDAKFIFSEIGYNFQPIELEAAFGLEQLKKLGKFSVLRKRNYGILENFFRRYEKFFILPRQDKRAKTNWLAFPLTIRPGAPFSRLEITKYLEERDIQTRPVFTGNVLKQPAFKNIKAKQRSAGYPVTDRVMTNGFVLGCHHGLTGPQQKYLLSTLESFLSQYSKAL
ncbi:MAG: aminotransferase class I/II-fold pyridoxal phosphate-dependent enzyme [bacterium]|nr:aminotransferase class I/II-fold pyridoxal phosphate-dependent enzyme [bacterium]